MDRTHDQQLGRHAERPKDIPGRGKKDVLRRVKDDLKRDHVGIVAAGMAFYALLAVFPALIAMVAIYGLVSDPAQVEQQVQSLSGILPSGAADIVTKQLHQIATNQAAAGIGALLGILAALWSASKGAKALIEGINIAYDEEESRGFVKLNGVALLFTFGGIVVATVALGLIAVLPAAFNFVGLGDQGETIAAIVRWPLLVLVVMAALALAYRYAPSRDEPKLRWVTWGSIAATVIWIAASLLFSWYVSAFGKFNETYGALGGVVILLLWFWISAYIVLFGAELNSELEHQTAKDTTEGPPKRMGERGATKADTLPESRHTPPPRPRPSTF